MILQLILLPIMLLFFWYFTLYTTLTSKNYLDDLPKIEKKYLLKSKYDNNNSNSKSNSNGSGTIVGIAIMSLLTSIASIYSLTLEYEKLILDNSFKTILCHKYLRKISTLYIDGILSIDKKQKELLLQYNFRLEQIPEKLFQSLIKQQEKIHTHFTRALNEKRFCKESQESKESSDHLLQNLPFKSFRNKFSLIELNNQENNIWQIHTSTFKKLKISYKTTFYFTTNRDFKPIEYKYETTKHL
ncbi:MAG: hypothetical protein HQK49_03300 [Oligoflexia bacterium]|nr:hypothetical protein [Oligoflexia bacterium]